MEILFKPTKIYGYFTKAIIIVYYNNFAQNCSKLKGNTMKINTNIPWYSAYKIKILLPRASISWKPSSMDIY